MKATLFTIAPSSPHAPTSDAGASLGHKPSEALFQEQRRPLDETLRRQQLQEYGLSLFA